MAIWGRYVSYLLTAVERFETPYGNANRGRLIEVGSIPLDVA